MSSRPVLTFLVLGFAGCAVAPPVGAARVESVGERLAVDEQRINEGARLGQFTTPEYNELQARHANIERTRREQLAMGGGRFAPGQYEALLSREDALSRTIFEYRHNGATPTAH